jgi:DNA replication protein DnaC
MNQPAEIYLQRGSSAAINISQANRALLAELKLPRPESIDNIEPSTALTLVARERPSTSSPPDGFDEFWAKYPRHTGKAEARKRWAKMKPDERVAAMTALAVWAVHYATVEQQFIPHASTWLNQRRWEDDPPVPQEKPKAKSSNVFLDMLREGAV